MQILKEERQTNYRIHGKNQANFREILSENSRRVKSASNRYICSTIMLCGWLIIVNYLLLIKINFNRRDYVIF